MVVWHRGQSRRPCPKIRALFTVARTDDFIIFEDERWPMPRVLKMAGAIGHALVHDLGVTKGDRVAIAVRNYPEWIATFVVSLRSAH